MIEPAPLVFGPYRMKKLGKPATVMPRYADCRCCHASRRLSPPSPVTARVARKLVGWNPVLSTSTSTGRSVPLSSTTPVCVTAVTACGTSSTLALLSAL
jgi:hypothetical protein